MGFSPQQVDAMSVWQYMTAVEGYQRANDPEAGQELTVSEADDLWNWIQSRD